MTRPKRLKRMSMSRKALIGREAVDWIIALESRRRSVPMIEDAPESSDQRGRLIEMERFQHRFRFQAYDVALALKQAYDLLRHLKGRRIPRDVKAPLDAFLAESNSKPRSDFTIFMSNMRRATTVIAVIEIAAPTKRENARRGTSGVLQSE